MLELVDHSNRLYVMAHSKKGTPAPTPIKIGRPYDPPELEPTGPRPMATGVDLKRFLAPGPS